jgi:uncharacterized membrane protein YheB (UPF0754 family)
MNIYIIWLIPPISALIGWITNYIAVKMIFRPRKPFNILGIKIWGLIPKRKSDLARKIGETVETELISHQDIHKVVNSPEFHEQILISIINAIEKFIEKKLGSNPIISIMLSGEIAGLIKELVKDELRGILPDFMENMFEKVEGKLDFKEIVRKKIEEYDFIKLEQIIYKIASRELRYIEVFGGILGFIIGLAQVGIIIISSKSLF